MRSRTPRHVAIVIVGLGAISTPAFSQSAAFIGTVARGSNQTRLGGADITIAALNRSTTTGNLGDFRLGELAPGRYAVTIRHVGFKPITDTVELKPGGTTERAYTLAVSIAELDSVRIVGRERKYISPGLNAFEERRKLGFGYFLPDSLLREHDSDRLSALLRRIPGINLVPYRSGMYAGSNRASGSTRAVHVDPGDRNSPLGCWATVYLNGTLLYSLVGGARGDPAIDFNSFSVNELAGVEFYHSAATIPAQYASTEYGCGTVLLWIRER